MAAVVNSTYFIGTNSAAVGLFGLFGGEQAAHIFGVALGAPLNSSSSSTTVPNFSIIAYLAAKDARDLTLSIAYFVLGYTRNSCAVRVLMWAHAVTGIVDVGVVSKFGVSRKAWCLGVGAVEFMLWLQDN